MKKLLLISVLLLTGIQCQSQQGMVLIDGYQEDDITKVNAFVDKVENIVILAPTNNSQLNYIVKDGDFEHNKEYVFWLRIKNCDDCRAKKAEVVDFAMTTNQAQRDQQEAYKRIKKLKRD
tara:strand:- start:2208 stop:2567 length:360 start_codon:yes stop_codon:yes gene_type:complete